MIGYIYLIKNNINQYLYIGKRVIRGKSHKDSYMGSGTIIKKSIKIHGVENFKKQYLEFIFTNKKDLAEREKYWIQKFSNKKLYNLTSGGDGFNGKHTEESKVKIGKAARNKNITQEFRIKMSNIMKGKPKSGETIEKIRNKLKGRHRSVEATKKIVSKIKKSVCQYDLNNNIIKIYESILQASIQTGINKAGINLACAGKIKTSGGFYWKYYNCIGRINKK